MKLRKINYELYEGLIMNKKLFCTRLTSIFLLTSFSLLSACSDADEHTTTTNNNNNTVAAIQNQVVTVDSAKQATPAKQTKVILKDITGLYKELPTPQPTRTGDKIEVLEVFWYACPHCYHFEPVIDKWLEEKADYIEFVRMPGILGKNWLPHAKAFYVAEKIGILDIIHKPLFDAIHKNKRKIFDKKSLKAFFSEHGVSGNEFDQLYNSKEVEEKAGRAFTTGQSYMLTGVPAIIINGKYRTSTSVAGDFDKIIDVINTLAAKEHEKSSH